MQSLEVAVYEAAEPDGFAAKQADLHRTIASLFGGYVGSLGLRSVSDPKVYADIVLWESAETAGAAAAALPEKEELAWFPPEIAAMRFFDHFAPARDGASALSAIGRAPVIEVVLLKPALTDGFAAVHTALHAELAAADVVVEELRLEMNDNGVVGDVNGWTTPEAMEQLGPVMMAKPELTLMFNPENEMVLFMPFAPNYAS